jgi:hypothetical protein
MGELIERMRKVGFPYMDVYSALLMRLDDAVVGTFTTMQ